MSGRVGGGSLARGFGFVVFCGRGGGGVAAFWAYVGLRAGGDSGAAGVATPDWGGEGCGVGRAWVGLEPLI